MMYLAGKSELLPPPGEHCIDRTFLAAFRKQHGLRRADFYTAMAAAAALAAAEDSCFQGRLPEETGIFVSGRFGPQNTTAKFLDELLTYPEDQLLAAAFSHSVHNAPASYIAQMLSLTGPILTMTRIRNTGIESALTSAAGFLAADYCSRILLIQVQESGYIEESLRKRNGTPDANRTEFAREHASALLLTRYETENRYGWINPAAPGQDHPESEESHEQDLTGRN